MVFWMPEGEGLHYTQEELDHEFLHLIIPFEIGVPSDYLLSQWPQWLTEAFTVGLSQRRGLEWLRTQLAGQSDLTIGGINNYGLFHFDQRRPESNTAYQYCVWLAEALGVQLRERYGQQFLRKREQYLLSEISPLLAICSFTCGGYQRGLNFKDAVSETGIDLVGVENGVREKLALPRVTKTTAGRYFS